TKEYLITLNSGTKVQATLVDPEGKPIAGVLAMGLDKYRYNWSKPLASEKLEVPAFNPEVPRALIFLHPARGLAFAHQATRGDAGPWTIRLQPTATVSGRLVLPDGKPYPNVSLSLSFKYP